MPVYRMDNLAEYQTRAYCKCAVISLLNVLTDQDS